MEFNTELENFTNSSLWGHHIIVPDDIVQDIKTKSIKRLICTLNDTYEFHCALMPKGQGIYFIMINSDIRKKMKMKIGVQVNVKLKKDESKYGMPMPEEFGELLKIDDEANTHFHALTPGKQRNLLYIIGKPKSSDIRLNKAIVVTEHLKMMNGKLDFKILNQAFKDFNQHN